MIGTQTRPARFKAGTKRFPLLAKHHPRPKQQAEGQRSQSCPAQRRVERAAGLGQHASTGFDRQREREPGQQGRPRDQSPQAARGTIR
jgi:hypothetical protein